VGYKTDTHIFIYTRVYECISFFVGMLGVAETQGLVYTEPVPYRGPAAPNTFKKHSHCYKTERVQKDM
jgi:hypothetical protein